MNEAQLLESVERVGIPQVIDESGRVAATEVVLELKKTRAKIVEYWKPIKEKAYQAHREISAKEKDMLSVVDDRIKSIDAEIRRYMAEQERIRIAEKKRLEEEEKARILAEAEQYMDMAKAQEAKYPEMAKALESQAEQLIDKSDDVVVDVEPAKTSLAVNGGSSYTKTDLSVAVVDVMAFVAYCAAHNVGANFFDVKIGAVKSWLKAAGLKDVPGLSIKEETQIIYKK